MAGPDEGSGGCTADERAAFEATDDRRERARIVAGVQRRVLAERRADAVAAAWQRVLEAQRQSANKALDQGEAPTPVLEQKVLYWLTSGVALADPWLRDGHLTALDHWLLPELQRRQLSLRELEEVVAWLPHDLSAMLAPQANVLCPQLWRWLRDAQRRRLIRPASDTDEPTADTRWDLTEAGERELGWTRPVTGPGLPCRRWHAGSGQGDGWPGPQPARSHRPARPRHPRHTAGPGRSRARRLQHRVRLSARRGPVGLVAVAAKNPSRPDLPARGQDPRYQDTVLHPR
jgi:hypothetical protein